MSVAFNNGASNTTTGTTPTQNITTAAGNPMLLCIVAYKSAVNDKVNSVNILSGSSGTPYMVKRVCSQSPDVGDCFIEVWAIPAPVGVGQVSLTLSNSIPYQYWLSCYTGADQTLPCVPADSYSKGFREMVNGNNTFRAYNLTANDVVVGMAADTSGDVNSASPNQRFLDDSTAVNLVVGDASGNNDVTCNVTVSSAHCAIAVRIIAAGGAPTYTNYSNPRTDATGSKLATSTTGVTYGVQTAVGDLVIVAGAANNKTAGSPTFSDNYGNTYTMISGFNPKVLTPSSLNLFVGYCYIASGGLNHEITFTLGAATGPNCCALWVKPPASGSALDTTGNGDTSSSSTAHTAASLTALAGELLYAVIYEINNTGDTTTVSNSPWSAGEQKPKQGVYEIIASQFQLAASAGSVHDDFTTGIAMTSGEAIFSFTIPSSGPASAALFKVSIV